MSFSFLHSVESNVALFSKALEGTGLVPQAHDVRGDLLSIVTERGGLDEETSAEVANAIHSSAKSADLVLLTCSSLSPAADRLKAEGVPVERTDRLLAEAVFANAMKAENKPAVAVLIAAPTTVEPTRTLFEACRVEMEAQSVGLDIILLPDVWNLFLSGDLEGYGKALTLAIDIFLGHADAFSHIALGQASMGPALEACHSPRASSVWTVAGATGDFLAAM